MSSFFPEARLVILLTVCVLTIPGPIWKFFVEGECEDCEALNQIELSKNVFRLVPGQLEDFTARLVGGQEGTWTLSFPAMILPEVRVILREPRKGNEVAGQVSAAQLTSPEPGRKKGPWFWDIIAIWKDETEGTLSDPKQLKVIPVFPKLVVNRAGGLVFDITTIEVKISGDDAGACSFLDVEPNSPEDDLGLEIKKEFKISKENEQLAIAKVSLTETGEGFVRSAQAAGIAAVFEIRFSAKCGTYDLDDKEVDFQAYLAGRNF